MSQANNLRRCHTTLDQDSSLIEVVEMSQSSWLVAGIETSFHDVLFAVNKERTFRTGQLLPSQQLRLVGMGGETINSVDASPNRNILAENIHLLGAVDNTARKSPNGCVADEHDAQLLAIEIVLEVVAHAAAGAHARAALETTSRSPAESTPDGVGRSPSLKSPSVNPGRLASIS